MIETSIRTRLGILLGTLALGAVLLPGVARAADTLDQAQTVLTGDWTSIGATTDGLYLDGQTFTAGQSGRLTRVSLDVAVAPDSPDPGDLSVQVYDTSGGFPSGAPLAATTVSSAGIPAWQSGPPNTVWVDAVFPAPPDVTAGHQYAIVLSNPSLASYWVIELNGNDLYPGGEEIGYDTLNGWYGLSTYDEVFKTWVEPAPGAAAVRFLDPLTGSSSNGTVVNTAKNGRVVPVKVQLSEGGAAITDANAAGPVTLALTDEGACGGGDSTDPVDAYAAGSSSSGTAFRYDASAQAWVYNLDTRALALRSGDCYRLDVSVDGVRTANAWAILEPVR